MALRTLQAALLKEREEVLNSLELTRYAGPSIPVKQTVPSGTKRRRGSAGPVAPVETPPADRRRSSRVAGVRLGPETQQGVLIDEDREARPSRSKNPPRIHVARPIGAGELHVMLQLTKGRSDKYYEITTESQKVITRNGRRGQAGVVREKTFENATAAREHFVALEKAKRAKGYGSGTDGSEEGAYLVPLGRWT
jgi:predicted DNA-binding WGR domain protein